MIMNMPTIAMDRIPLTYDLLKHFFVESETPKWNICPDGMYGDDRYFIGAQLQFKAEVFPELKVINRINGKEATLKHAANDDSKFTLGDLINLLVLTDLTYLIENDYDR